MKALAGSAWSFLFPPCCAACDAPVAPETEDFLCPDCRSEIRILAPTGCPCELSAGAPASLRGMCNLCRHLPDHFDSVRSAFPYQGVVGELIRRLKYRRGSWAAGVLARMTVATLADWCHEMTVTNQIDKIVPVPMHGMREIWRGANHSEELARELAILMKLPIDPIAVRRRRRTPQQSRRHGVERRLRNVEGAFDVPEPSEIAGLSILLVDDVMTTGATAATCAQAMKAAGARAVHVLTVARAGELATEEAPPAMTGTSTIPTSVD